MSSPMSGFDATLIYNVVEEGKWHKENINRQLKLNKSDNQIKQVQFCEN